MPVHSSCVALDFILLPESVVRDHCIRYNQNLNGRLVLGTEDRLPHCSLFMLAAERAALPAIRDAVKPLFQQAAGLQLTSQKVRVFNRKKRPSLIHLGIQKSESLVRLQIAAADLLTLFALQECPDSAFVMDPGEHVSESSRSWVLRFGEDSSANRYEPHITLGYGEAVENFIFPETFCVKPALFQLGIHCSCRRRLF